MAKRNNNILKAKKQARMRRAYLKGYDMGTLIRVQRRIGRGDIEEKMLPYFDYRKRGNSFWDPYLEAKFPSRGMISKERLAALDLSRRQKVMATLEEWGKLVLEEMNVIVGRGGITKTITRLFWNSDDRLCFFTKEDYLNMTIMKSMEYRGEGAKERAYFALNNNRIEWFESVDLTALLIPDAPAPQRSG